jgi:prepilin-type processing-associated H-X9-DG protein
VVENDPNQARLFTHGHVPPDLAQMNPDQLADWINDNSSFVYLGGEKDVNADAETVLMYERPGERPGNRVAVLFADGHVEQMPASRARDKLAEQGVEMQGPRGR